MALTNAEFWILLTATSTRKESEPRDESPRKEYARSCAGNRPPKYLDAIGEALDEIFGISGAGPANQDLLFRNKLSIEIEPCSRPTRTLRRPRWFPYCRARPQQRLKEAAAQTIGLALSVTRAGHSFSSDPGTPIARRSSTSQARRPPAHGGHRRLPATHQSSAAARSGRTRAGRACRYA
jgi:hypothetical protein